MPNNPMFPCFCQSKRLKKIRYQVIAEQPEQKVHGFG